MTEERLAKHKLALDAYLKRWVIAPDSGTKFHKSKKHYRIETDTDLCCDSSCLYAPTSYRDWSEHPDFNRFIRNLEDGFPVKVRHLAAEKKVKQIEMISLTGIGRSTFYRIMAGETLPSKEHCVEIALSLQLNYTQAQELLESAGYALSRSDRRDMALRYFFVNRIYDIAKINELLIGQKLALICDPD